MILTGDPHLAPPFGTLWRFEFRTVVRLDSLAAPSRNKHQDRLSGDPQASAVPNNEMQLTKFGGTGALLDLARGSFAAFRY